MSHTSKPWIAGRWSKLIVCTGDGNTRLATVNEALGKEAWPNAYLMAAAPDLLEALKELWADPLCARAQDRAKAAINKAEPQPVTPTPSQVVAPAPSDGYEPDSPLTGT